MLTNQPEQKEKIPFSKFVSDLKNFQKDGFTTEIAYSDLKKIDSSDFAPAVSDAKLPRESEDNERTFLLDLENLLANIKEYNQKYLNVRAQEAIEFAPNDPGHVARRKGLEHMASRQEEAARKNDSNEIIVDAEKLISKIKNADQLQRIEKVVESNITDERMRDIILNRCRRGEIRMRREIVSSASMPPAEQIKPAAPIQPVTPLPSAEPSNIVVPLEQTKLDNGSNDSALMGEGSGDANMGMGEEKKLTASGTWDETKSEYARPDMSHLKPMLPGEDFGFEKKDDNQQLQAKQISINSVVLDPTPALPQAQTEGETSADKTDVEIDVMNDREQLKKQTVLQNGDIAPNSEPEAIAQVIEGPVGISKVLPGSEQLVPVSDGKGIRSDLSGDANKLRVELDQKIGDIRNRIIPQSSETRASTIQAAEERISGPFQPDVKAEAPVQPEPMTADNNGEQKSIAAVAPVGQTEQTDSSTNPALSVSAEQPANKAGFMANVKNFLRSGKKDFNSQHVRQLEDHWGNYVDSNKQK